MPKRIEIDIDLKASIAEARRDIARLVQDLRRQLNFEDIDVGLTKFAFDARAAEQEALRLERAVSSIGNETVGIDLDTDTAEAELRSLISTIEQVADVDIEARTQIDTAELLDAQQLIERLDAQRLALGLDVDTSGLDEARQIIDRLEGDTINLDFEVDQSGLSDQFDGAARLLGSKIAGVGVAAIIADAVSAGISQGTQRGLDIATSGFAEGSEEFEALGKARGELVAGGFVSSFEEATPFVQAAAKALGDDFTVDGVVDLSAQLLFLQEQLEVDVQQAKELQAILNSQGFADGATESFDVLLTTAQNSQLEVSELAELYVEYGGRVDSAILPTEQFIGLLASADTRFAADKLVDGYTEFINLVGTGSDETRASLDALGVDYDEALQKINSGQGIDVFSGVLDQLNELDATQQRVLGEALVGSVGLDQIGALASANIQAIEVQAGATEAATDQALGSLARFENRLQDPLNSERFFGNLKKNLTAGFIRDSFAGEAEDVDQVMQDLADRTGVSFAEIDNAADRVFARQRQGARDTAASVSDSADQILRSLSDSKFDEDFFTYTAMFEIDDATTAAGQLQRRLDDIEFGRIDFSEIISDQEVTAFAARVEGRMSALRDVTLTGFVDPIGQALRNATDPEGVFSIERFIEQYAELQLALNEATVNALRIEAEDILPDDLIDVWADVIEEADEPTQALLQKSVVDAFDAGGAAGVENLIGGLRTGIANADLATVLEQAVTGQTIDVDLLGQLDDSELELLANTAYGIQVTAQTDLDELQDLIASGNYQAIVDADLRVDDSQLRAIEGGTLLLNGQLDLEALGGSVTINGISFPIDGAVPLDAGGVLTQPTLAMLAEAGHSEAVIGGHHALDDRMMWLDQVGALDDMRERIIDDYAAQVQYPQAAWVHQTYTTNSVDLAAAEIASLRGELSALTSEVQRLTAAAETTAAATSKFLPKVWAEGAGTVEAIDAMDRRQAKGSRLTPLERSRGRR